MSEKIERRFTASAPTVRSENNGEAARMEFAGLGVSYDTPSVLLSEDGKEFVEYIRRGAFADTLESASADVMMLYSHDWNSPLARRSAGNLTLTDTEKGIEFVANPPETTRAQDLLKDISAGNIRGMSFGFTATADKWSKSPDGTLVREVLKGVLYELSPVVSPAYADTAVASRSLDTFRARATAAVSYRANKLKLLQAKFLKSTKGK